MKMKYYLIALFLAANSYASASQQNGTIKGFYIDNAGSALLILDTDNTECGATDGWDYQFDTKPTSSTSSTNNTGAHWVSMILAARMSGSIIRIGFTGNENSYCSVNYIYYYDQ